MKRIDKFMLLQETNGGLDFYQFVFDHKLIPEAYQNRMENVLNPFCEDTKPSFSIYLKSAKDDSETDKWCFNDFGDESYFGDVFDFAAYHYNLDIKQDFNEILSNMIGDLNIDETVVIRTDINLSSDMQNFSFELIYFDQACQKEFTENYFLDNYSIPYSVCLEYGARAINGYRHLKGDKIISFNIRDKEVLIAYTNDGYAKLYQPLTKNPSFRFSYLGKKPKDYIFGWNQILNRIAKYKSPCNILILTGGEKDVLSLATLGYDAICFNSETASIPSYAIEKFFQYYDKVIIMYDNDDTGCLNMEKNFKLYKIARVILPSTINGKPIKDISDCMKYRIDRKVIDNLISNADLIYKDVEPIKNIQVGVTQAEVNFDVEPKTADTRNDSNHYKLLIPQSVYASLPTFLQNICTLFEDENTKDLVLLSSLTVLSTCFPKVKGIFDRAPVGANLYFFLTGRSACGKGDATWSRKLLTGIEDLLKNRFISETSQYKKNLCEYEKNKAENPDFERPEEPVQKNIGIPANSSTAKLIEILEANKNFGLIFETEGNVMSFAQNSDWSSYSNQLRQAFHHERIEQGRKSTGLYIAESPHLSVLLTGTLEQVPDLIKSVENGLFSRFFFYDYPDNYDYRSPFAKTIDYNKYFSQFSNELLTWWLAFESFEENCLVSFTSEQIEIFDDYFAQKAIDFKELYNRDIVPSIRRMQLICFRFCMLLTVIRHMEIHKKPSINLIVDDIDFCNVFEIIEVLCEHLGIIFSRFPNCKWTERVGLNGRQRALFESLPDDFTWEQCKEIAQSLDIPNGSAEKYRRKFVEKELIIQIKNGVYRKKTIKFRKIAAKCCNLFYLDGTNN